MGGKVNKDAQDYTTLDGFERKVVSVAGLKVVDNEQGIVEAFVAGIGNVDDGGDVIEPTFFESSLTKHLKKNPKGVYAHQWERPVSKLLETRTVPAGDPSLPDSMKAVGAGGQYVKMQYMLTTESGRDAFEEVKFFEGESEWSIGYLPIVAERDKAGVRHLKEGAWYEWSQVLFGMNPITATVGVKALAQESGMSFDAALDRLRKMASDEINGATVRQLIADLAEEKGHTHDAAPENISEHLTSSRHNVKEQDLPHGTKAMHALHEDLHGGDIANAKGAEEVETKKAVARHKTDTSDAAWDGPANEANLKNEAGASIFRKAFAWVDPEGDAATKAAYRFIHHEVNSDGVVGAANTKACSTGIGVLNGGRGGTTIPEADKAGVHRHLAGHMSDAGMQPPELKADPGDETKDAQSETKQVDGFPGSFEERITAVDDAVRAWVQADYPAMNPDTATPTDVYSYTLATWGDHAIACVMDWDAGERSYFDFPYVTDADGVVTLGVPAKVDLVTTVVPAKTMQAQMATKAGARHSKTDQEAIQTAHDALVKAGADCAPAEPKTAATVEVSVDDETVFTQTATLDGKALFTDAERMELETLAARL